MSQLALMCPLILQIKRKEKEKKNNIQNKRKKKKRNNNLANLPSHDKYSQIKFVTPSVMLLANL